MPTATRGSTSKQLLEVYQDCLDSIFTPLWGRFYFHLTSSRDAGSMEQILWTFEYTHTFIHLLLRFCSNLTTSDSAIVVTFPGADFREAGISQIIEKTCRFMRSHVAECLVILNPLPIESPEYKASASEICMSLIEHSLLLDHDIHKFQHGIYDEKIIDENLILESSETLVMSPLLLPVSAVFCSNPIVRNLWLQFDHMFFLDHVLESMSPKYNINKGRLDDRYACRLNQDDYATDWGLADGQHEKDADLFGFYFDDASTSGDSWNIDGSSSRCEHQRCFACVYDCLIAFHKAYQRYSYLPAESHDLFSAYVLEPLLLCVLGLVMFRTNTCLTLQLLFKHGKAPHYLTPGTKPAEGIAITDTVHYLQNFLSNESSVEGGCSGIHDEDGAIFLRQSFTGTVTPPSERFADNWSLLQSWVRTPDRRYVSNRGTSSLQCGSKEGFEPGTADRRKKASVDAHDSRVFSARDVVEKAFSLAAASGRNLRDRKKTSFVINKDNKLADFSDVIHFVRAESEMMKKKLNKLLDKVANKSCKDTDAYVR